MYMKHSNALCNIHHSVVNRIMNDIISVDYNDNTKQVIMTVTGGIKLIYSATES